MASNGKGYVEDRRPASNIDPYVVSAMIFDTGVLERSKADTLVDHYVSFLEEKNPDMVGQYLHNDKAKWVVTCTSNDYEAQTVVKSKSVRCRMIK